MLFFPNLCEVWVQLLTEDILGIDINGSLDSSLSIINCINPDTKTIRDDLVFLSKEEISHILNTFKFQLNPYLPAHHLWGGEKILENTIINDLIKREKLIICGSPSIFKLGPFHHTITNAKIIKSKINKFSKNL